MDNEIIDRSQAPEELQKALRAANASNVQYEQVISMISDIIWRYDVQVNGEPVSTYISPVADRMLGLPAGTIGNSFAKYFSYVHPDDLPVVQEILSEGIRMQMTGKTAEYRYQPVNPFDLEMAEMLRRFEAVEKPEPSAWDGYVVDEIIERITESAATGQRLTLHYADR